MSGGGAFLSSPFFATGPLGYLHPGRCSRYVHHPVDVGPEAPVPVAFALHELHEAPFLEQVQVALDGPRTSGETTGEGLHTRPAEAGLVVGVISEGAVGGNYLRGYPSQDQVVDLGYTGKPRLHRH